MMIPTEQQKLHSGVMVAFYLPSSVASLPVVPDGQPEKELHLTLAYLGDGATLDEASRKRLCQLLEEWSKTQPAVRGQVSGLGRFSSNDGPDPLYASFDAPQLPAWRQGLVNILMAAGFGLSPEHGFSPHIILAWLDKNTTSPIYRLEPTEILFDRLSLVIGEDRFNYALGPEEIKAASLDERIRRVCDAFYAKVRQAAPELNCDRPGPWAREVFDTYVVVEFSGGLFAYPYTMAESGEVTFGQPVQVEIEYRPVGNNSIISGEMKAGARHSAGDTKIIQGIHDAAVALGANCPDNCDEPEIKAVQKFFDFPLAARDRTWDAAEAQKRARQWAGGPDQMDWGKYASLFMWRDPEMVEAFGGYKLQYADIIDGQPHAVPRALFAIVGGHGVEAADIPQADKKKVRDHVARYYDKMRKEFDDDSLVMPDAKGLPQAIKAISEDEQGVVVGGYMVMWGKRDLREDYFTQETELWIDHYKTAPALFHHSLDEVIGLEVIGHRVKAVADLVGLWVEDWLDKSNRYWGMVQPLLKAEALYYSPGSASHLVRRKKDGELKSFPVIEDTLTPTPMQHYLRPIEQIKSAYATCGLNFPCLPAEVAVDQARAQAEAELLLIEVETL
jgi:2'-5' RNA ligase